MAIKHSRFDLDWWIIEKRQIYILITLVVLSTLGGGVSFYVWKHGSPFKTSATVTDAPAGASGAVALVLNGLPYFHT